MFKKEVKKEKKKRVKKEDDISISKDIINGEEYSIVRNSKGEVIEKNLL